MKARNINELQDSIKNSPVIRKEFLKNPEEFILKVESPINNKRVFLTVVYMVGIALIICLAIGAIVVLSPGQIVEDSTGNPILLEKEIDNFFVMIGSAAIGALAGLLAPSPTD